MNRDLYDDLIEVAKAGGTTTYSQIAPIVGLKMSNPADRNTMSDFLMEISEHENNQGRPMLSAVVISEMSGKPGGGFFELARDLGLFNGFDDDKFYREELERVYAFWIKKKQ